MCGTGWGRAEAGVRVAKRPVAVPEPGRGASEAVGARGQRRQRQTKWRAEPGAREPAEGWSRARTRALAPRRAGSLGLHRPPPSPRGVRQAADGSAGPRLSL